MIQGTSLDTLRSMEFFSVVTNIDSYLIEEDLHALKLDTVHTTVYRPALEAFDKTLQPFRKTGHTQTLLELDDERDAALLGIRKIARAFADFPETQTAEAATRLLRIFEKYGKAPQSLSLTQQTGVVVNLLQDLEEPAAKTDLQTIGATGWAERLKEANSRFETIYRQRTREEAAVETGQTAVMRKAMQEALTQTCNLINALALVNGSQPYEQLIDNINREITRAKQIVRMRSGMKAAHKKEKDNQKTADNA